MKHLIFECILRKRQNLITLGGDNKINVAIASYKPNVKCDPTSTPGPAWNSCVAIFANMRATKQARVFGYAEDTGVEEELPLVLEGGKKSIVGVTPCNETARLTSSFVSLIADGKCQAKIDIDGPATVATWYEIWEAVTAIANMCTRQKKKGGKAKGLGRCHV